MVECSGLESPCANPQKTAENAQFCGKRHAQEAMFAEGSAATDGTRTGTLTNIYFIGSANGPIKIGRADDPASRLISIQTGNPHRLDLILSIPGPASLEAFYHRKFSRFRMAGEWFRRCGEIEHEILRLDPTAMNRIDEWADLAGTRYGCDVCGPYPCRLFVHD